MGTNDINPPQAQSQQQNYAHELGKSEYDEVMSQPPGCPGMVGDVKQIRISEEELRRLVAEHSRDKGKLRPDDCPGCGKHRSFCELLHRVVPAGEWWIWCHPSTLEEAVRSNPAVTITECDSVSKRKTADECLYEPL